MFIYTIYENPNSLRIFVTRVQPWVFPSVDSYMTKSVLSKWSIDFPMKLLSQSTYRDPNSSPPTDLGRRREWSTYYPIYEVEIFGVTGFTLHDYLEMERSKNIPTLFSCTRHTDRLTDRVSSSVIYNQGEQGRVRVNFKGGLRDTRLKGDPSPIVLLLSVTVFVYNGDFSLLYLER